MQNHPLCGADSEGGGWVVWPRPFSAKTQRGRAIRRGRFPPSTRPFTTDGNVLSVLFVLPCRLARLGQARPQDVPGVQGTKGCGATPHTDPISQSANLPISQNAPAGIQGTAPLDPQSPNLPIPLCPLCPLVPFVVNPPWPSCVRQHAPDLPQSAESAVSLRRAVLCESLYFSVALCVSKLSPAPTGGKVRGR